MEQSAFRNEPKWEIPIKLKNEYPNLPILCDASHISGNTNMIHEVSQTALDLNMDGLMLETHNNGIGLVIVCDLEPAEFYSESLKAKGLTSTIEIES